MANTRQSLSTIRQESDVEYKVTRKNFLFFSWNEYTRIRVIPTSIKEDLLVDTMGHKIRDVFINGQKYVPSPLTSSK